jgi:D-alanyl-D-alanine carboxypeptidase
MDRATTLILVVLGCAAAAWGGVRLRAKSKLPALGAAIVTGEGLAAIGAVGVRRAHGTDAVTADDRWHLGSCTKAMTATLVARLVERGTLTWTTTVADAFPGLKDRMDPGWRAVTIEQLLVHRAGAPPDLDRDDLWARLWRHQGTPTEARRLLLEGVVRRPPSPDPGTRTVYSNAGYAIAGHMLETITGTPWEDLMRREVFAPLGMSTPGFGAPGSPAAAGEPPDQPRGHRDGDRPVEPGPGSDNPPAIAPAGTVHASLADWGRFVMAHLRGARGEPVHAADGSLFLTPESWRRLHTPGESPNAEGHAAGWGVATRPWARGDAPGDTGRVLTHAGSNTMWFCVAWVAPEKGFAALVTCNDGGKAAARAVDEAAWAVIRDHQARGRSGGPP